MTQPRGSHVHRDTLLSDSAKSGPQADLLSASLRKRGMSMNRLAKAAGINASTLSRWLSGERVPRSSETIGRTLKTMLKQKIDTNLMVHRLLEDAQTEAIANDLIKSGVVGDPRIAYSEGNNKLSVLEASMRPELLSSATIEFFSLPGDPFLEPDGVEDVFMGSTRIKKTYEWIIDFAKRGQKIGALMGEPGCGKTTLAKKAVEELKHIHNVAVIWPEIIDKKNVTEGSLQDAILKHFTGTRYYSNLELRAQETAKTLKRVRAEGQRVVMILDEGHDLPPDILRTVKRLNEMRDGFRKLLSVLILAQPEFEFKATRFAVREFGMRTAMRQMPGLVKAKPFIEFRLRRSGMSGEAVTALVQPAAWDLFETKIKLLKNEAGESSATPLAAQNLFVRCLNYAADVGDRAVTAEHVGHVQDKEY